MQLHLQDESRTLELGAQLGEVLKRYGPCPLLFRGPLGSGKTTLVRGLVGVYPGGEQAEVTSPSFNLVNIYPTSPEIIHLDLYRILPGSSDEILDEYLNPSQDQIIVEWSEHLAVQAYPDHFVLLCLDHCGASRRATLRGQGKLGAEILVRLRD